MNTPKLEISRLLLLGAIMVVLLILMIALAGLKHPGLAVGGSSKSLAAISPGQEAAIHGASQLLLIQPQTTGMLYLPLIRH